MHEDSPPRKGHLTISRVIKYISSVRWLFPVPLLVVSVLLVPGAATSHDAATARNPTEKAVFEFYATWMRPPGRFYSCCNMQDCHVVQIKQEKGRWLFLDTFSYSDGGHWRVIPPDILEQNASDPRESPDGNSHVCFNASVVLCAVLGSGQ